MRLIYQNYPWSAEVPEENEAFIHIRMGAFHRDTEDWTSPETGEFFPASMRYFSKVVAQRRLDGGYFYTIIWLDKDFMEWPPDCQQAYLDAKVLMALAFLNTFAKCPCTPDHPCNLHDACPLSPGPSTAPPM